MIEKDRELTEKQKAEYFDRIVESFIKWNNADLDYLRKDPAKKSSLWKYKSRQDAAGYEVFTMLGKEHIIRSQKTAAGQQAFI